MRLRSISERSEASQAPPSVMSNVTAAARMTTRKAAISFRKIPFLTASPLSLGGLEAVARAAHGFQVARVFRVGFDFFADAANVNIHRARRHIGSIAPDRIQKMIAGENAAEMAREIIQ